MLSNQSEKLEQVLEAICFYRGIILDSVQHEMGDRPSWPSLRSRLLKALGERGLEYRIRKIFGTAEIQGGQQ